MTYLLGGLEGSMERRADLLIPLPAVGFQYLWLKKESMATTGPCLGIGQLARWEGWSVPISGSLALPPAEHCKHMERSSAVPQMGAAMANKIL